MNPEDKLKFTYLLERPTEPLYRSCRGHGSTKYLYHLPAEHLEPYQMEFFNELRNSIPDSMNVVHVTVKKPKIPYDLTPIHSVIPRKGLFCELSATHLDASTELYKILMSQGSRDDFFNASALCRDSVNPNLWIHAFIRAISKRRDTRGFQLPAIWEIMPDMFIERRPWQEALQQAAHPEKARAITIIDKNFTGTNLNPEHKVAYFSEDIGANSHHWHWHLVNPSNSPKGSIDRKGEIFYYMHHSMLARYDTERLANGMNRVVPFDIHDDLISEGYFPKLAMQNSTLNFAGRQENTVLQDIDRSQDPITRMLGFVKVAEIRSWCDRIIEAIDAGFAVDERGGRVDLRNDQGIDVVTAMQSSWDSPNRKYYGTPHNYGHGLIGCIHDPNFRFREPPGAMYLPGTSMRDSMFYRWHRYVDLICQRQKDYLPVYSREILQWTGISVNEIEMIRVEPSPVVSTSSLGPVNAMVTHWMQSDIELSRGLDFGRTNVNNLGSVWVRATHLQHVPFVYRIKVTNETRQEVEATVRIFMAPKFDENGDKLPFFEQRILFFEMDKFTASLKPGESLISQKSEDSTLTIPWAQTFQDIERNKEVLTPAQSICNCGWPQHLLLPRGTEQGMIFDLFVMLTPTQLDQVPSSRRQLGTLNAKGTCRDSISYCGLIDDKIPDGRPMGFPFDRPVISNERSKPGMYLDDFSSAYSNIATAQISILHMNKTILRENGAPRNMRKVYCSP